LLLFPIMGNTQSCQSQTSSIPATTQFTINNDGTATDVKTGLMWKRCIEGQTWNGTVCTGTIASYTWSASLSRAQTVNTGVGAGIQNFTYNDWRLPNVKELNSIVERTCRLPAINSTVFPNMPADFPFFWTSSPFFPDNNQRMWIIRFEEGVKTWDSNGNSYYVRLVRGN
jgi:hypothetical protein